MTFNMRSQLFGYVHYQRKYNSPLQSLVQSCRYNDVNLNICFDENNGDVVMADVYINNTKIGSGQHAKKFRAKKLAVENAVYNIKQIYPCITENRSDTFQVNAERQQNETLETCANREIRKFYDNPTIDNLVFSDIHLESEAVEIQQIAFSFGFNTTYRHNAVYLWRHLNLIHLYNYLTANGNTSKYICDK